ncbi:hypothetical protein LPJ74_006358 [Coemansia sp. RSA 1843]|nr:hypothetical protein LPJ74_006358 [Coemansia sp. RSA 1843]
MSAFILLVAHHVKQAIPIKSNPSTKDLNDTRVQLFDYSQNIYASQHDRRFVWGLTFCGESVSAYILSNCREYSSPVIDITDVIERKELIYLLVGWSLCRKGQLGFDETIVLCSDIKCYEIHVPSGNDPGISIPYCLTDVIMVSDRLFGCYCRCFLATPRRPPKCQSQWKIRSCSLSSKNSWMVCGTSEDDENTNLEADVKGLRIDDDIESSFVWPSAQLALDTLVDTGEVLSEINILDKINKVLGSNTDYNGLYPTQLNGGWVHQPLHTRQVLDCTREILFGLENEQKGKTPFCFHVRYAMELIGEPLKPSMSASELIVVLCNAMRCHKAISDECTIFHRDVLENNILVVRNGSGVYGLLIDFNFALDQSAGKPPGRLKQTGTLPFMNIGSLANSEIPRTMLDDWESLLYLVCWYGTFEISENCEDQNFRHRINRWCVGCEEEIADQKRSDLITVGNFYGCTARDFGKRDSNIGDGERLKTLAVHLHKYMFFNLRFGPALSIPCHGTQINSENGITSMLDDDDGYDGSDISPMNNPENMENPSKPIDLV